MRDLVLVRHAVAEPRDIERWPDDSLRPLTPDGLERFRGIARGLRRIDVEVEAVLASPYARAWATGEILHEEAAWPAPEECPALEPQKRLAAVVDAVCARGDATLALVGHQPQLSELAALRGAARDPCDSSSRRAARWAFVSPRRWRQAPPHFVGAPVRRSSVRSEAKH